MIGEAGEDGRCGVSPPASTPHGHIFIAFSFILFFSTSILILRTINMGRQVMSEPLF